MYELLNQVLGYLRGIWRYRWVLMGTSWLVAVLGWTYVLKMPDEYRASATIHVDTDTVLRPLLRGLAVSTDPAQRVAMMTRTLVTRPNLEKLARMTDLDLTAKTPADMENLINSLKKRLEVEAARRYNLYTISFTDPDRDLAKRVVQSLLTIFVESNLGRSREDTDAAQRFLEDQLKQYAAKLDEAEKRLADFKRRHVGMLPGEGADYYDRLQKALSELEAARLQLKELEQRREAQLAQLEDIESEAAEESLLPPDGVGLTSTYDSRIENLQSQLDELLLRFTERHPDVLELRRLIADLEKKREEELATMRRSESGDELSVGRDLAQQYRLMLSETEAQIAAMKARVQAYEEGVKKLQDAVDTLPKVEAELKRLSRDYEVHKANYEQLLQRREQVNISEQADISSDDVKFRIVEPPQVPLEPDGPNRILFMTMVLGVALGAGVAVAFMLSQINPTFDDAKSLKEFTGRPVFGSVSMVFTDEVRRKRYLALFSFVVAGVSLVLVYGMAVIMELMDLAFLDRLRDI